MLALNAWWLIGVTLSLSATGDGTEQWADPGSLRGNAWRVQSGESQPDTREDAAPNMNGGDNAPNGRANAQALQDALMRRRTTRAMMPNQGMMRTQVAVNPVGDTNANPNANGDQPPQAAPPLPPPPSPAPVAPTQATPPPRVPKANDAAKPKAEAARKGPTRKSDAAVVIAPGTPPAAAIRSGKFSFEFAKAEIGDVVKAISDMTQRNFIIPERIKSQRITILSPTKITSEEAYQVFIAALAVNGITLVKIGKFYKLLDAKEAIKTTIPTCVGEGPCPQHEYEQMITELVALRYVDGNQISNVVKSLVSKEGEVILFPPTNALILSEFAPNLARIKRIVLALDVPGFDDELRIVQLQYATSTEIADKLTQIFEVQAPGGNQAGGLRPPMSHRPMGDGTVGGPEGVGEEGGEVQISKIIPDDRTNQLIIKANRRSFAAIEGLIAKLDVPISDSEQGKVHVYYLENASAEDLASTLSSLSQGAPAGGSGGRANRMGSNNAGGPPGGGGPTASGPTSAVLFEGEVKITADKATNSLVVVATPHDFRSLRTIIEKLDKPRRQVYVEAAILEVTVTDKENFGLNWHAPGQFAAKDLGSTLGGPGTVGFVQSAYNSSGVSPTLTALNNPTSLLGVAGGSIAGIVGKGMSIPVGDQKVTLPSFGVILKWLQSSSNANVLSTPHILTTDNEEASIEVGQKIPFQSGTALPAIGSIGAVTGGATGAAGALGALGGLGGLGGGLGSLYASTNRIDVKLTLTLTPHVNEGDKIRLEIDQKIEDLIGRDERTQQPITANRAAKTVVVVDDQQTVVLGGLMRDRTTTSESKIPILGDLPLIGWLFKQRSNDVEKVNLLLVLTPYIIHDSDDFQRIFERKVAEHEEFAAEYYADRPQYRAHINYARKVGPMGTLIENVRDEMDKYENGGEGDGNSTLVSPDSAKKAAADKANTPPPPTPPTFVPVTPVHAAPAATTTPQSVTPPATPAPATAPVNQPVVVPAPEGGANQERLPGEEVPAPETVPTIEPVQPEAPQLAPTAPSGETQE